MVYIYICFRRFDATDIVWICLETKRTLSGGDLVRFGQKRIYFRKRVFFSWRSWTLLEPGLDMLPLRVGPGGNPRMRGPAVRKQGSSWVDPDCVAFSVAGCARRHVFWRVDDSGWSQRGASSFFFHLRCTRRLFGRRDTYFIRRNYAGCVMNVDPNKLCGFLSFFISRA